MRIPAILLLIPAVLPAQDTPRAVPVDPALQNNAGQDFFQHGRNVYESAKRTSGPQQFDLYSRSAEIFTRYLTDHPNHPNAEAAWWYLGQSYYETGRVEDAKRCFHSLLNRFGKGRYAAAAAYTLAADHFNNRQYALAATLFEKLAAIATQPSDRQRGLFFAGKSHELQNRRNQAITHYKTLIEDPDPGNPYISKARAALGSLFAKEGKLEEALPLLDQVVMSPSPPDVRGPAALEAGAVAARLGDAELSDKYLNLVLTTPGMEDFRPDAQITMMSARFDQKRYNEVVQIFSRSRDRTEGEREARRLMLAARSYMMLGRNADAMPLFREIERIQIPDSSYAFDASYYRLLCFYRVEGRHVIEQVDAFLQLYRKKHPRDPKIHTALLMKAETLYSDKKPAEAADVYRDIDPSLLSASNRKGLLYQRGRCLVDAKDPAAATASLSDFIKEFPDDENIPLALAARGRAYHETGQSGPALADFNRLIEATSDEKLRTLAYLESAEIHKEQNEYDGMISRYLEFLETIPNAAPSTTAKASYWTGWAMVKNNRGKDAVPHLEKARALAPKLYDKHAGLLLCLVHLSEQSAEPLIRELEDAIVKGYSRDLPDPLIRWAADQAFNGSQYREAARFYDLIADDENPLLASKDVWRFLGKARIESGDPAGALTALGHALESETDPAWQADGKHDRGRAMFQLKRYDEALATVDEGLALRPEGRTGASLHLLKGDILMAQDKPVDAVRSYILPVQLMDDGDVSVRPLALHRLVGALEKSGKPEDAAIYTKELADKYPGWKAE